MTDPTDLQYNMIIFQQNLLLQSEAKVYLNHLLASTFGFSPYQAQTTKYPNNRKVKQSTGPNFTFWSKISATGHYQGDFNKLD